MSRLDNFLIDTFQMSTNNLSTIRYNLNCCHEKDWAITVKVEIFQKFLKAIHDAKKTNPRMQNSRFLDLLLEDLVASSVADV